MDRLTQLEYFLAVVDSGGFSAAAATLGVAPSAPIRAVATLEQNLKVQLFRRTTRRVSITEEGIAYAFRCRAILTDLSEANRQITESAVELAGSIRITAPVMLGRLHVAPLLAQFLSNHPKVTLDFQLSDQILDLVAQSFDLGVRIGQLNNSSMIAQQVGQVQRVVCASPDYWRTYGKPKKPSGLMHHRCVHFDGYAPHSEWEFEVNGKVVHARPQVVMTTNRLDAALSACIAGMGCGVFLSYQVNAQLRDRSLMKVLPTYAKPAVPLSLVMPPGRMASARVKALKQWLAPELQRRLAK